MSKSLFSYIYIDQLNTYRRSHKFQGLSAYPLSPFSWRGHSWGHKPLILRIVTEINYGLQLRYARSMITAIIYRDIYFEEISIDSSAFRSVSMFGSWRTYGV